MAYQQKDNEGSLFKNKDKEQDSHADYTGSITVAGVEYWLNAWINAAQSGRQYLKVTVRPKQKAQQAAPQKPAKPQTRFDDMDSDVPFANPYKGAKAHVV